MNEPIVTVLELKQYKGLEDTDIAEAQRLVTAVLRASSQFERWTFRSFLPRVETLYYNHPGGSELVFDEDLLEVLELKTQGGAVTITADQYYLTCGASYNSRPYDRLTLKSDAGAVFSYSGTPQRATSVKAVWGYHERYDSGEAWEPSTDTVQNSGGLDSSSSTLEVTDVDGLDLYGRSPRFTAGQLLQIEDELLYVARAAGVGPESLYVIRGARGSTAASHNQGTAISIWRPWPDVVEHVKMLAAYLYDLKDSQVYDVTATPETGQMILPKGIPVQVKLAVEAYKRR